MASLKWFTKLAPENQALITQAMKDAASFQRRDNRDKDASRLVLLREKGMQVVDRPDIDTFHEKVAGLKDMALYQDVKVQTLLLKLLDAVK